MASGILSLFSFQNYFGGLNLSTRGREFITYSNICLNCSVVSGPNECLILGSRAIIL